MSRISLRMFSGVSAFLALSVSGHGSHAAAATASSTHAADEAAIRAASGTLAPAVEAKDLDKAVSLYVDDAVLFVPKAPAAVGRAAIRQAWQGLLAVPGVKLTIHITAVDVARSGDIAVERGTFQVVVADKEGKPSSETGQLVIVWKKQANGSWKIVADTNADDQ
jgi:uncharacterized protein (TIGR02246 family)